MPEGRAVRVLIVDDSAIFRRFLARALTAHPGLEVIGEAESAEAAAALLRDMRPDVMTLDLEMPGQGGLAFLRETVATLRIPTLVISSQTPRGAQRSIEALDAGALDVMPKPRGLVPGTPDHVALAGVAARIKAVARARMGPMAPVAPASAPFPARASTLGRDWVIALGASTGGVQALGAILAALPADCPPVVIVQHMPEGFTDAIARRFDAECAVTVREARQGDRLSPGLALIAPGGERHMELARGADGGLTVDLVASDPVCFARPSVDVLFHSAARVAAPRLSGAILTGMGRDGAEGLLAMRLAGAQTFAQDEASSVIFGMPARAWEAGGAMEQVPLDHTASRLLASVGTGCAESSEIAP